jgi:hypothetical protein
MTCHDDDAWIRGLEKDKKFTHCAICGVDLDGDFPELAFFWESPESAHMVAQTCTKPCAVLFETLHYDANYRYVADDQLET